ncbi:MAG: hypothetical protein SNJ56_03985 [Termitinemataceae bacterium]
MKRWSLRLAVVSQLVFFLSSCEFLYSGKNLFSAFDGPDVAALKSTTGSELVEQLEQARGGEHDSFGDTFVASLKQDPGSVDAIYSNLQAIFENNSQYNASTKARAALLAADLIAATSELVEPVVNNVVSAALNLMSDPEQTSFSAADLVVALFGNRAPSKESFVALMNDMARIATAYDALGEALNAGAGISLDAGDGQTALIAFTVTEVLQAVNRTKYEEKVTTLYETLVAPSLRGKALDENDMEDLFGDNYSTALATAFQSVLNPDQNPLRAALYNATRISSLVALLGGE